MGWTQTLQKTQHVETCGLRRALARLMLAQGAETPPAHRQPLSAPLAPQPVPVSCEGQQWLLSQSKTCNFWLQALLSLQVLLCCQDAAGPDSSESRLQRGSASNIFGCDTTEILFH